MKASLDQSNCVGCGACAEICPDVFRMTDDNIAEVFGEVTAANEQAAHDAAESCPVSVITIE